MRYWLGLGANLGDRAAALQSAVDWLRANGVTVEAASAIYETAPRELVDQPAFLNAALRVDADDQPRVMLDLVKRMEAELGRVAGPRFGPRAIDCDLLVWEGGVYADERLEIPHPRLVERRFALVPLLELDPDLRLPDGAALSAAGAALDSAEQPVQLLSTRVLA
jgi:2-amino-4-hydroxy-6-hydroxymethyldihydropteridine diphosphokinase